MCNHKSVPFPLLNYTAGQTEAGTEWPGSAGPPVELPLSTYSTFHLVTFPRQIFKSILAIQLLFYGPEKYSDNTAVPFHVHPTSHWMLSWQYRLLYNPQQRAVY